MKDYLNKNFEEIKSKLALFFLKQKDVCFAYIFGSLAKNKQRLLSDIDIAIYFQEDISNSDYFKRRLQLLHQLYRELHTEKIDLIVLNNCPLELTYRILISGSLLIETNSYTRKRFIEKTINTYLDFYPFIRTRNQIVQKKMIEGSYFD